VRAGEKERDELSATARSGEKGSVYREKRRQEAVVEAAEPGVF
jgi:hypothetical protein